MHINSNGALYIALAATLPLEIYSSIVLVVLAAASERGADKQELWLLPFGSYPQGLSDM